MDDYRCTIEAVRSHNSTSQALVHIDDQRREQAPSIRGELPSRVAPDQFEMQQSHDLLRLLQQEEKVDQLQSLEHEMLTTDEVRV